MEILKVIALLCQVGGNNSTFYVEQKQLECQKYYLKCIDSPIPEFKTLTKCVQERKL